MTQRELFFQHMAQTSASPLALEFTRAEGSFIFDSKGRAYLDLISGIAVSNVGHRHPRVIAAINAQLDRYMHLMVYGEYIQSPQVRLAERLSAELPATLNCAYFVNSGSEAIEGALKLAKRYTGRTGMVSFKNAYHGSTQGALSIMGNEVLKQSFRPLLPDVHMVVFNNSASLAHITEKTACVVVEPIQGEAGVILPSTEFMQELRQRCNEKGVLLIADEIQCGFGRTGKLFAFEHFNIVPDILCLAKGMGAGMPIGAFMSSKEIMSVLSVHPPLGHITTFGGHPVCCAASLAGLEVLAEERLIEQVPAKEELFRRLLKDPRIKEIRSKGLLIAIEFEGDAMNERVIANCISRGVLVDWFLFNARSMRIAPPLTITEEEIKKACTTIMEAIASCH